MLVSAFAGRDHVLAAYAEAIRERYRFYSFGDCVFITGRTPHPYPTPSPTLPTRGREELPRGGRGSDV